MVKITSGKLSKCMTHKHRAGTEDNIKIIMLNYL